MLKKYALFLALAFTLVLGFASFVKFDNLPHTGLSLEDKLFHFLAYFILTLLWFNYLFHAYLNDQINKAILIAVGFAIIYGTIIEVLQGQLTINRVTEFNDALANSFGAFIAALFIKLRLRYIKKY